MPRGILSLIVFLLVVFFLPYLMADIIVSALARLGLSPGAAVLAAFGIFAGSLVNLPVWRLDREEPVPDHTSWLNDIFGSGRWAPAPRAERRHSIIAVNVGGCLVPLALVLHEVVRLAATGGPRALGALAVAVALNVVLCQRVARPVPNVGIAMPPLAPALAAAGCALLLAAPEYRTPVAFCAGVLGPLVGADLLHLKDIGRISTGVMSIGGAGTFDGIVLSGLLAIMLA